MLLAVNLITIVNVHVFELLVVMLLLYLVLFRKCSFYTGSTSFASDSTSFSSPSDKLSGVVLGGVGFRGGNTVTRS